MKHEISLNVKKAGMIRWGLLWVCVSSMLVVCSLGYAADFSTFAGGEIDGRGQGFSYLGVDLTQNIDKTIAVSGRVVPNYLTYKYYAGDNTIRANSPGLSAIAGVKLSWDKTMLGIWGGVEFRDTTLSPDDQGASVRGSTLAGLVQGEFDTWFPTKTNLNIIGSFSGTSNFSYERARIKQQITNLEFDKPYTLNVGVEQFFGHNADFHQIGGGLMVELFHIAQKVSFILRGGVKHDSTFGDGIYGGLELYKGF